DLLKRVLAGNPKPDVNIVNKMGILAGDMGDFAKQEKFYREAASLGNCAWPLFNLALSLRSQNRINEAIKTIDEAIKKDPEAPFYVLRAMLAISQKDTPSKEKNLELAFSNFDPIPTLDDWELGWYITAAGIADDKEKLEEANAEQRKRRTGAKIISD